MRVFIAGIDGYLGWSLACYLTERGHEVFGVDNGNRRRWVSEVGGQSLLPIDSMDARRILLSKSGGRMYDMNLLCYEGLREVFEHVRPEAIVHLGEMPSAPFSMISAETAQETQVNNFIGSLNILWAIKEVSPEAHLIKIGTMGSYGTPPCPIPEGVYPPGSRWINETEGIDADISGLLFHRSPGSFYHSTKVGDSINVDFACRVWGLKSTDVMQGVVYGTRSPGRDPSRGEWNTRFDADEAFGTAINRFVAASIIGEDMTLYGKGHQRRGFLPLCDSMQCLRIALENPPEKDDAGTIAYASGGMYRTWNQFEEVYDLTELAKRVQKVAKTFGLEASIRNYVNPRVEAEEHAYDPIHEGLLEHGYVPTTDMEAVLSEMFEDLLSHASRIQEMRDHIIPRIRWDGRWERVLALGVGYGS